jgi:hypothetical protein
MPGQMPFSIRALRRGQAVGANVANLDLADSGPAFAFAFAQCATARFLCEWDFLLKIVAKNIKAYYFIGTSLPSSLHAVVQFIRGCQRHQWIDSAVVG